MEYSDPIRKQRNPIILQFKKKTTFKYLKVNFFSYWKVSGNKFFPLFKLKKQSKPTKPMFTQAKGLEEACPLLMVLTPRKVGKKSWCL